MFLTSRMNFMIIRHDLEVLWKKRVFFWPFLGSSTFDPKIFTNKIHFKLKNWLLHYFFMMNPKKIVPGRSVDTHFPT